MPTPQSPATLLYVVNIPRFFVSHRLSLALAARDAGYIVHIATANEDSASIQQIKQHGFPFHPLPLSQHGLNPCGELRALYSLRQLYASLRPDLLHHVSIKPVIYGGIAARLTGGIPAIHALSGLGYIFASHERKARLLARLSQPAFRLALAHGNAHTVFQNPDDQREFLRRRLVSQARSSVILGSGVDETVFQPRAENATDLPIVLFAGRLLWQKGLGDFVELARRLQGQARFQVAGYEERSSPLNVPAAQLRAWHEAGTIEWLGKRDDMPQVYADSHIVCLPSTYGEGVPKTLIEAAACARACVTTNTPGCREIVRQGENGILIPPNDIDALVDSVQQLVADASLRQGMGARGRQIALERFTLRHVIEATLALYQSTLDEATVRR